MWQERIMVTFTYGDIFQSFAPIQDLQVFVYESRTIQNQTKGILNE